MANYFSNLYQGYGNWGAQQSGLDIGAYDQMIPGFQADIGQYQGLANTAYGVGQGGLQGYSPEQIAQIMQLGPGGQGLQGVNPMSQADVAALQFNPAEQAAMMGGPGAVTGAAGQVGANVQGNVNQLGENIVQGNAGVTGAAGAGQQLLLNSVDPSKIGLPSDYKGTIAGALGQEQATLGSAVNNPNLGLSQNFQQNYQFGPQDMQRVISAAGQAAGSQYTTAEDELLRAAAAQGETSPLAVEAAKQNLERQGAATAGAAMTQAQIQAKQTQLGVLQAQEQMRLGTAQDIASRQMQAGESLAGTQIGAANTGAGLQIGASEAGQGLALGAASQAAGMGTQAAEFGAGQMTQGTEFGTQANLAAGQLGVGAQEYADTAGAQRAAAIANEQRQYALAGSNQAYQQGMGVNQAMSNRYTGVANTQQANQQAYRNYLTGQQQFGAQGYFTGLQGRQSAASQGAQLGMQGAGGAYSTQTPSIWSKLGGAAIGAAGALASAGAGGAARGATVYGASGWRYKGAKEKEIR